MRQRKPLTKTAQRGYLYLALAVSIVLILVCWPAPQEDDTTTVPDTATKQEYSPQKAHTDSQRHNKHQQPRTYTRHGYRHNASDTISSNSTENSPHTAATPMPKRKPLVVDLNEADTLTLQLLYGIGPIYASRIVKYRERLGGYVSTDQLLEIYGITPELLAQLTPHLTLSTSGIRRIAINSVTLKQLIRHPYMEYYQARDIIAWRNQGHRYNNIDDLRLLSSMDDSTLQRLSPYLSFE